MAEPQSLRERELQGITRYTDFPVMIYRTNLLGHSQRVARIVTELLPIAKGVYKDDLDETKCITHALVHDDAEIITGDIPDPQKGRHTLEAEFKAIEAITRILPPTFMGYDYKELLLDEAIGTGLEFRICKLADRIDGFCETLHELFAGNEGFLIPYSGMAPFENYNTLLGSIMVKYAELAYIFGEDHDWLKKPNWINVKGIAEKGKLHTLSSVAEPHWYGHYDAWRKMEINTGNVEGLVQVVEDPRGGC